MTEKIRYDHTRIEKPRYDHAKNLFEEYVANETWKCPKSPSGAHYWTIKNKQECKYCGEKKQIPIVSFSYYRKRKIKK